jgi:hypothetical protein
VQEAFTVIYGIKIIKSFRFLQARLAYPYYDTNTQAEENLLVFPSSQIKSLKPLKVQLEKPLKWRAACYYG